MNSSIVNKSMLAAAIMLVAAFAGVAVFDGEDVDAEGTMASIQYKVGDTVVLIEPDVTKGAIYTVKGAELVPASNIESGKVFLGWAYDTDKTAKAGEPIIADDFVFTAKFGGAEYNVTLVDGETILGTGKVAATYDETTGDITFPLMGTVTFKDADGETVEIPEMYKVIADESKQFMGLSMKDTDPIKSDCVVSMTYRDIFDVTWNVEGTEINSGNTALSEETIDGNPVLGMYDLGMPTKNPSKDNYEFAGWAINGTVVDPLKYEYVADVDFVAQFSAEALSVTMKVGETVFNTQTVLYGQKAIEPMKLEGYDGWTLDATADPVVAFDFNTVITENITLFAIAEKVVVSEEITVTYIFGDNQTAQHTIVAGNTDVFPTDVAKEGYNFLGWFIGVEQVKDPAKQVFDKDTIVIAQYVLADPPVEPEPKFHETTTGKCVIILAFFVLGLAVYQANKMGYFAVVKNKLFRKKVEAPVEGEEAGKP